MVALDYRYTDSNEELEIEFQTKEAGLDYCKTLLSTAGLEYTFLLDEEGEVLWDNISGEVAQ